MMYLSYRSRCAGLYSFARVSAVLGMRRQSSPPVLERRGLEVGVEALRCARSGSPASVPVSMCSEERPRLGRGQDSDG